MPLVYWKDYVDVSGIGFYPSNFAEEKWVGAWKSLLVRRKHQNMVEASYDRKKW